jgi:hypothetical protein
LNVTKEVGHVVLNIDMTSIYDKEAKEWLRLAGTRESAQNIWLSIDDKFKGIVVYSRFDKPGTAIFIADVVFWVDNSGSMTDESKALARDIFDWATELENSDLDVRSGCVGYGHDVGEEYSYLRSNLWSYRSIEYNFLFSA